MISAAEMFITLILTLVGGTGNHLLDFASTEPYWKNKGVVVSLETMMAELKAGKSDDVRKLIILLSSPDPKARAQAEANIRQKGESALPQLREAIKDEDPQIAASARTLIDEISLTAKISAVRRLMAIRTLGEMKKAEAIPLLKGLATSEEMFVGEYARRAIASIEGKPIEKTAVAQERRAGDLWLLPADCRLILQQTLAGAQTISIDAMIDAAQLPAIPGQPAADKAQLKAELTKSTLLVAEQIGDVRLDCVTAALSSDPADKSGFAILIVRAQYDAAAARMALRKLQVQSKNIGATEVFSPEEHIALLLPANDRIILITGPSGDQLPMEPMLEAIKAGKGELATVQDMTKLIETIDTTQPLWGVMKVTDTYRKASVLAPFDSLTLVGQVKAGSLEIRIEAQGDNANAVKDSVAEVNQGVQQGLAQLKQMAGQIPFSEAIIAVLESIKCSSDGLKATLTASMKGDATLLLGPMLLFRQQVPQPAKP